MNSMFSIHTALCAVALLTGCHKAPATTQGQLQPQQTQAQSQQVQSASNTSGLPSIARSQLPPEGQQTLRLIERGGPFPYPKDGVVFGNYEHVLPAQARGYYHEYTVPTPGARSRATRRIVCGVAECYYTADHYATFARINP